MTDVRKDELAVSDGGATLNVPTKTGRHKLTFTVVRIPV
jgi:hypothetical protein